MPFSPISYTSLLFILKTLLAAGELSKMVTNPDVIHDLLFLSHFNLHIEPSILYEVQNSESILTSQKGKV